MVAQLRLGASVALARLAIVSCAALPEARLRKLRLHGVAVGATVTRCAQNCQRRSCDLLRVCV